MSPFQRRLRPPRQRRTLLTAHPEEASFGTFPHSITDMAASPPLSASISSENEKGGAQVVHANTQEAANKQDVAADIDFSHVDEAATLRKMDYRLIPVLAILYLLSFLDRG